MNKNDLVEALWTRMFQLDNDITLEQAKTVVRVFFDSIRDELASGGRVEIRGLFAIKVRTYDSYAGRNPRTGEKVTVSPKKLPVFRVGKELMKRLNQDKIDKNP